MTAGVAAAAGVPEIEKPHSRQNFMPAGDGAPQLGQTAARAAPHSPQNLEAEGFSLLQLEQRIRGRKLTSRYRAGPEA